MMELIGAFVLGVLGLTVGVLLVRSILGDF